jgi:hypothetical protein
MRRIALISVAVLSAAAAGCGGDNTPEAFRKELKNYFGVLNREASAEKEAGAALVHEYDATMPEGDAAIEKKADGLHATVSYLLVTKEREVAKLSVPQDAVPSDMKPADVPKQEVTRVIYKPVRYARGRLHFRFTGGRLVPDRMPYEEVLGEEERLQVIKAPPAKEAVK